MQGLESPEQKSELPVLRREVIVTRERPRQAGIWLAACMFAGIFAGFSVKTIATTRAMQQQMHVQTVRPAVANNIAWLGVSLASQRGDVRVQKVFPGTPAQAAGLRPGDRIHSVAGRTVRSAIDTVRTIRSFDPDDVVEMRVIGTRNNKRMSVNITVRLGSINSKTLRGLR